MSPPAPDDPKSTEETRSELSRRMLIGGAAVSTLGLAATALKTVLPEEAAAQSPPTGSCFFALQIEGFFNATFPHVSGLGSETLLKERAEGKTVIRKIPGATKWGDIQLKRGIDSDQTMWTWRKMVQDGHIDEARKDGSIVMLNPAGNEIARWNFEFGWPSKVEVESAEDGCAWELLTLTVDAVRRVEPRP
jgi:phage tail-like protein